MPAIKFIENLLEFLINKVKKINCIEKKIDSDQNDEWNNNKVGSKHKKQIINNTALSG